MVLKFVSWSKQREVVVRGWEEEVWPEALKRLIFPKCYDTLRAKIVPLNALGSSQSFGPSSSGMLLWAGPNRLSRKIK